MPYGRRTSALLCLLSAILLCVFSNWNKVKARDFGEREVMLLNIGIPALWAGLKAYHADEPIEKAVMQATFGGLIMHQGFKQAPKLEKRSAVSAWQAKLMVNMGASLIESAGQEFIFRMDLGPVWLTTDGSNIKFRPAINATLAPIVHIIEGSKFDLNRSLKYGTMAFKRKVAADGTLVGSDALAYSNANTFTTDSRGTHAGHEMVHIFQYRRDAIYPINLSSLFPEIERRLGDDWIDDTSWSINWGLQCAWADYNGKSKDFDILLEKEAYYLEQKFRLRYLNN